MRVSSLTASAVTAVLMLSACATSGRVDRTFAPSQLPKTIFVSERQSEHEGRHLNQVIRTFEKYGYEVVKEGGGGLLLGVFNHRRSSRHGRDIVVEGD